MADLTPEMRGIIDNMRTLAANYEKQRETLLAMLECVLWEVKHSRPYNYTGWPRDNAARDRKKQVLVETLEAVLASAGRDVSRLRSARDPAANTGD